MPDARPFLKWAGGKTQLLPHLLRRAPKTYGRYFEPFLGGGALFFALKPAEATLSDANPVLVLTYRGVQSCVEDTIRMLGNMPVEQAFFASARQQRPLSMTTLSDTAAWMIYLNKTCFNGLWRVNALGTFNVPWGHWGKRKALPRTCDPENLRACSLALQGAWILHEDFAGATKGAREGDFVYFDPPYVPAGATADFTAYTADGFGPDDQVRLRDCARELVGRGVQVLLSNSDTPMARDLYPESEWCVERVEARRAVSCKGNGRGVVGELIIGGRP